MIQLKKHKFKMIMVIKISYILKKRLKLTNFDSILYVFSKK